MIDALAKRVAAQSPADSPGAPLGDLRGAGTPPVSPAAGAAKAAGITRRRGLLRRRERAVRVARRVARRIAPLWRALGFPAPPRQGEAPPAAQWAVHPEGAASSGG